MITSGAFLVNRAIPQGKAAIWIPAAAIEDPAFLCPPLRQKTGAALLGTGHTDTERLGKIALGIG